MTLNGKTLIPLGTVVSIISVVIGGVLWLNAVASDAKSAKEQVSDVRDELKTIKEQNTQILERVSRIEGRLSRK